MVMDAMLKRLGQLQQQQQQYKSKNVYISIVVFQPTEHGKYTCEFLENPLFISSENASAYTKMSSSFAILCTRGCLERQ